MNQLSDELRMAGYDLGSATGRVEYASSNEINTVARLRNTGF